MKLPRVCTSVTAALFAAAFTAPVMAQPTGGFIAVLDDDSNNSDSSKSVVFYDADDMSSPLFAVFMGWKDSNTQLVIGQPVTTGDARSVQSMTVDPVTGDTYVLAIDRDAPQGTVYTPDADDINFGGLDSNTEGDYDLLKVDFQFAYNDWVANQGMNYVTYINTPGQSFTGSTANANEVDLPGVLDKIGEVSKPAFNDFAPNGGASYIDTHLDFVDQDTLVVLDRVNNAVAAQTDIDNAPQANDAQVRVLSRVSTSPGAATAPASPGGDGGWNEGTSESWESTVVGSPMMDSVGLGEYVSTALVNDPATGTLGLWIGENDQPGSAGDPIAFFEINNLTGTAGNGLKQFNVGGGTDVFILDDNPVIDPSTNDGDVTGIHVNPLTGDLFIIEGGFFDTVQDEPSIIIREVTSYDNGLGQIEFGGWDYVQLDTSLVADDDTQVTEGRRTAYDYVNNVMYFYDFDNVGAGGGGSFVHDWYAINLDTGVVTASIDADDSTRAFGSEDRYEFFCLGDSCGSAPLVGDLNGDGFVGIDDLNIVLGAWNQNVPPGNPLADPSGDGFVGIDDLNTVLGNWNAGTPPTPPNGGAAVPEPASLTLLTIAAMSAMGRRRKKA